MKKQFFCASFLSLLVGCSPNGMNPLPQSSLSPRVLNAADRGPVPADMMFDLVVGVRMRDELRLPLVHKQLAERQDALSPEDFGDQFGVTRGEYARFVSWLRAQGLEIVRQSPSRTTVTVRGNAMALNQAFGVQMHNFQDRNGMFTASTTPIAAANEALSDLTGVVGIDNSVKWESHLHHSRRSRTPSVLRRRPSSRRATTRPSPPRHSPARARRSRILSTNDATLTSDLDTYLSGQQPAGVTQLAAGQYTQVFVGGPSRDPSNGAYVENVLDAEMVLATAPFANIVQVFTATNGGGLFADGISYIVNNQSDAHVVTVSWGTCERGSASEMPILNALFAQARPKGSSGSSPPATPAPTAAAIGSDSAATRSCPPAGPRRALTSSASAARRPLRRRLRVHGRGAGGGVSESLDKPAYQVGATPADSSRDEPDVAAIAGGSGVLIVDQGGTTSVLGTSAAHADLGRPLRGALAAEGAGWQGLHQRARADLHDRQGRPWLPRHHDGHADRPGRTDRRLCGGCRIRPRDRLGRSEPHRSDRELAVRKAQP